MTPEERTDYIRKNKKISLIIAFELLQDIGTVVRCEDNLYRFNGKHYDILTNDDLEQEYQSFVLNYGIIEEWKIGKMNEIIRGIKQCTQAAKIPNVEMNGHPNLLCLNNGVLNTSTLEFVSHSPNFYFDTSINIDYDPESISCPNFIQYLNEVQRNNQDNIANLIRLGGYLLDYSHANMKKCNRIFFFDGEGGSGKSTLLDTFRLFFSKKQITALTLDELSGKNFENAQLIYSRVNISGETKKAMVDSEGLKLISEGSEITVRPIYKEPITIRSKTKVLVACNGMPRFNDQSEGMARRLLIFRFRNQYKNDKQYETFKEYGDPAERGIYVKDVDLFDKIESEKSAIFNLFLGGLRDLTANKFQFIETDDQVEILNEFKSDNDIIREFLNGRYTVHPLGNLPIKAIFNDFQVWYHYNVGGQLKMRSSEVAKRVISIFNIISNGKERYKDPNTGEIEQLHTYPLVKIDQEQSSNINDTQDDDTTTDSDPQQTRAVWLD